MKRVASASMVVLAACVTLGPGPAGAGEASNDTVVTSERLSGGGYRLVVTAASGQANSLRAEFDDCYSGTLNACISDQVGITDDSPTCAQVDPNLVACKLQGLRRIIVFGKDGDDTIRAGLAADTPADVVLLGGEAANSLSARGPVTVRGRGGADTLRGRRGNQRLLGGRGGDGITCGRGNDDLGNGQRGNDSGGAGCETKISL